MTSGCVMNDEATSLKALIKIFGLTTGSFTRSNTSLAWKLDERSKSANSKDFLLESKILAAGDASKSTR
jgi:hypothetical protein